MSLWRFWPSNPRTEHQLRRLSQRVLRAGDVVTDDEITPAEVADIQAAYPGMPGCTALVPIRSRRAARDTEAHAARAARDRKRLDELIPQALSIYCGDIQPITVHRGGLPEFAP